MALLFDAYGDLLTEKQRQFFALYYHDDLSLGEIAETHGISRQGVYDILKRSERTLQQLENHLQLVSRDTQVRQIVGKMTAAVNQLRSLTCALDPELCERASEALDTLTKGLAEIGR
jgi:predicted DNA-binding protein YlxM (UPF0122 family)